MVLEDQLMVLKDQIVMPRDLVLLLEDLDVICWYDQFVVISLSHSCDDLVVLLRDQVSKSTIWGQHLMSSYVR